MRPSNRVGMKICVTLVGVCRPSFLQVKQNIERNMQYFRTTYPQHTFDFLVLAWKNSSYEELRAFCESVGVACNSIEPVQESEFVFPRRISNPNIYRMYYSMNRAMDLVAGGYDCVLRVRLDAEVLGFEIHDVVEEGVYYILQEFPDRCGDNVSYGSYKAMKQVWRHENCLLEGTSTEHVVHSTLKKYNYRVKPFKFHYRLYQSSDTHFDGVAQWSKRSREWIYDGKDYVLRDI